MHQSSRNAVHRFAQFYPNGARQEDRCERSDNDPEHHGEAEVAQRYPAKHVKRCNPKQRRHAGVDGTRQYLANAPIDE